MNLLRPRPQRFSFDPRLAIGLALVVGSVAGVYAIVTAADETVLVYAAPTNLAPGDRVTASDLSARSVRLDSAASLYLVPGDIPAAGVVVTRSVNEGELVPASAIGGVDGVRMTSLVISPEGALAASILPGSVVDIWATAEQEDGRFGAPTVISSGATVVRLVTSQGMVVGGETTGVELLVPRSKIARVLEAIANKDALSIVPASIPHKG